MHLQNKKTRIRVHENKIKNMKKRQLSPNFLTMLLKGAYYNVLKMVQEDDTVDMEMRGESVIIYYRGGKLFELYENGTLVTLDDQYGTTQTVLSIDNIIQYSQEAKHLIDRYQTTVKRNLGEKEISQRIVQENNYSPYSIDTDYFIVDMEFNDGKQFDLVALKWEATKTAHQTKKCTLALVETKQGYKTLRSSKVNPGLNRHYSDYMEFVQSDDIKDFKNDMLEIFKQKCILGLINGINGENDNLNVDTNTKFQLSEDIEFVVILANYKQASRNLANELKEIPKDNCCKFSQSSFMGYGLYSGYMLNFEQFSFIL